MSSLDIDIILLENGFVGVKIFEDENETFQASFNKESTIRTLIEYYEDKKIQEFPKDLLNKLKSQKDENVTIEGDLLINYITGYEENNLALSQKESINIPEIIARPISNPFTIFTFVKKEKALKVLKFERNDSLEELKDYGPSSAYCNGNNFLFISGGENPNNELVSKFFKIDLINAQIETTPMAPKKNHSMIFIQGDYVFVIGGQTKDTFYYDLNGNKFCGWGKLNKNRIEPALILVNNYLYCFDNTNSNNNINEKFTFERSNIYSENHTWEICEPNLSLIKMNQKYFGISQNNDDIIFIGGSLDLEGEDNNNSKERKNLKYNISNNTIEESDIPFIDYNFKEKTFLKYNEKINYILPDFNRHQPEVMFYQKEKNVIRFLKCYSKKKLEEKEKAEKNIRDYSPIKIGFKLNLNQPKENENVESVNININPININANLNNEFIKVENEKEKENKNGEIIDLKEEINNENQNEEYKNQEEEYKNENENEDQNEMHEKNSENNNLGDDPNNLLNNEQYQDLNIENYQSNPENDKNNDVINEEEKEEVKEEDTNNLKYLKDILEYSKPQLEENVEINEGENQEEIKEDILKGPNTKVDVNIEGNNEGIFTNNGNLELEGKGNVQNSDINPINNDPKINIQQNIFQNQTIDLDNMNTVVTKINASQIPKENNPNNQINQDSNIQINISQPNNEVNPNINMESNNPQPNVSVNPGMDTNVKTDNNNINPQMGPEFGVSNPNIGYQMNGEFLLTGIILGINDNEENFKEMKLKDPNLQIIHPGANLFIYNPNAGFNSQDPNTNIQQSNVNMQGTEINTNAQQPNVNMQGTEINTNAQQPNVNMQGTEINTNVQKPNVNMQGTEINTNVQQPNVNMQGSNMNTNAQLPDPGVYNEKGEYVISGFIVGFEEKDPEILKYKKNTNMEADLNRNNNMNADLNAQGNLNNNPPQGGINANENMSGMNPTAPRLDINGNISGGNSNMQNAGVDNNINLAGQSPQISNNLNPNANYKGSQVIRIPNVEITDPKVGGNFTGNLNTNIPSNFDPKAEIKPAEIKIDNNIKPMNVDNCYDAQGNFRLTGIIPSKNDNNLNESINNLSMTNLLLLQNNRVDTKLNRSKMGSSNINQSIMNTNQLNTDLGNDNRVEMNVGLNVIKEDEK